MRTTRRRRPSSRTAFQAQNAGAATQIWNTHCAIPRRRLGRRVQQVGDQDRQRSHQERRKTWMLQTRRLSQEIREQEQHAQRVRERANHGRIP